MVLATTVRTPSSRVELPLLTLQILTQLMYDRDALKQHYESCKNELDLHKQNKVEEADRWQQRADELQAEITTCRSTADDCLSQLKTQTTLEKEIMHNNSKLFEAKDAAQKRVQELLDIVKSLEDDVESRSRLMKGFQQYLRNLILIHDDLLKQHSKITTITKHHKSEILRIDIRLSDIFQNFIRSFQNYQKELMEERLRRLLNGKSKEERLLEAAKLGNADDISLLLYFGVDTETRGSYGRTALYVAAESGNLKACEVLLDGGANIEARATGYAGYFTPIFPAVAGGHLDMVRLLVERGASLAIRDLNGDTLLFLARYWKHHDVAKYLKEKGVPE